MPTSKYQSILVLRLLHRGDGAEGVVAVDDDDAGGGAQAAPHDSDECRHVGDESLLGIGHLPQTIARYRTSYVLPAGYRANRGYRVLGMDIAQIAGGKMHKIYATVLRA